MAGTNTAVSYSGLTASVQKIKAGVAILDGLVADNSANAAETYVQVFDATGTITLGVTAPTFWFVLAPSLAFGVSQLGLRLTNGLQVAATTTPTGSTAPANAIPVTLLVG